jgi:hypothetical protein
MIKQNGSGIRTRFKKFFRKDKKTESNTTYSHFVKETPPSYSTLGKFNGENPKREPVTKYNHFKRNTNTNSYGYLIPNPSQNPVIPKSSNNTGYTDPNTFFHGNHHPGNKIYNNVRKKTINIALKPKTREFTRKRDKVLTSLVTRQSQTKATKLPKGRPQQPLPNK